MSWLDLVNSIDSSSEDLLMWIIDKDLGTSLMYIRMFVMAAWRESESELSLYSTDQERGLVTHHR